MSDSDLARIHAFVEGRVQGVGFRMFSYEHAQRLNLTGWTRNTWNGEVEIMAEGRRADLLAYLDIIRRGPRSAFVTNIRIEWLPYSGEFQKFQVKPTV